MGLFEFWGESRNPGSVGYISKGKKEHKPISYGDIMLKFVLIFLMFGVVFYAIFKNDISLKNIGIYCLCVIGYCFISYYIIPKPDYSNIGWLGGLMDHPLRYSDDINRFLIFLLIALYPGRFTAIATVQLYDKIRYGGYDIR